MHIGHIFTLPRYLTASMPTNILQLVVLYYISLCIISRCFSHSLDNKHWQFIRNRLHPLTVLKHLLNLQPQHSGDVWNWKLANLDASSPLQFGQEPVPLLLYNYVLPEGNWRLAICFYLTRAFCIHHASPGHTSLTSHTPTIYPRLSNIFITHHRFSLHI